MGKQSYSAISAALLGLLCGLAGTPGRAEAQETTGTVRVRAESNGELLSGVQVSSGQIGALTSEDAPAVLRLPPGPHTVSARRIGYSEASATLDVRAGMDTTIVMNLEQEATEIEGIIVLSTRTGRRVEDEPVRVEVLDREEIEEKMMMLPGDISMMLNETSGLRVQTTSPSLGGANVRIQGLQGRYTQILSDGLPLYGQTGALSMLQIPPMDLGQVEVIKGVASALYGSSALGGVINLVSRRPDDEREVLLNQTTRGGTDAVLWSSGELSERWGYTLIGSGHRQSHHDVNDDGWADLAGYRRAVVRPRLFWDNGAGRSLFVTVGGTIEDREGGTLDGFTTPAGTGYRERLETQRVDAGLVGRMLMTNGRLLSVRASAMGLRHQHLFGEIGERDFHSTAFTEVSLTGANWGHTWVLGTALQHEGYEARDVPGFDYSYTIPSLFVQDEAMPADWITIAASGRLDMHSEYGNFFNPRLSVLLLPGTEWNARASVGIGHFAPTPFTEETEATGLSPLEPLQDLKVEQGRSASLDIGRTIGPIELNGTLFGSEIRDPLMLRAAGAGRIELFNAGEATRTYGSDLLAAFRQEPFYLTVTYTYTRSSEGNSETGGRRDVSLTPRHAAGIVGMWEVEDEGLLGVELFYTGPQALHENPYRETSPAYLIFGVLVQRRIGPVRVFVNGENLLDARQTRHMPLLLPARAPEGRWTTDAWAPLEGRTFNAGIRLEF